MSIYEYNRSVLCIFKQWKLVLDYYNLNMNSVNKKARLI